MGSILNSAGNAYPIEEWHRVIEGIRNCHVAALAIPIVYGIDAIHGVTYTQGSTLFPHNIGLAASRSRRLTTKCAEITAAEARASGLRWNFDPVFDVGRQPLWPRFPETFGESSLLCGQLGAEIVEARGKRPQRRGRCRRLSETLFRLWCAASGKDRTEAYISDLEMWEHHIPPFQAGIDAGASTVMVNSGSVNGEPVHASFGLLTTLLRQRMGFEGLWFLIGRMSSDFIRDIMSHRAIARR